MAAQVGARFASYNKRTSGNNTWFDCKVSNTCDGVEEYHGGRNIYYRLGKRKSLLYYVYERYKKRNLVKILEYLISIHLVILQIDLNKSKRIQSQATNYLFLNNSQKPFYAICYDLMGLAFYSLHSKN